MKVPSPWKYLVNCCHQGKSEENSNKKEETARWGQCGTYQKRMKLTPRLCYWARGIDELYSLNELGFVMLYILPAWWYPVHSEQWDKSATFNTTHRNFLTSLLRALRAGKAHGTGKDGADWGMDATGDEVFTHSEKPFVWLSSRVLVGPWVATVVDS